MAKNIFTSIIYTIGTCKYKTKILLSDDTITMHETRLNYMIDDENIIIT